LAAPPPGAAPTPDPGVFGGLKISGPTTIGVGWTVSYSATDHGGRPVGQVLWHALSDNIRVSADGSVQGVAPGSATVMATSGGMRAYFDFEVKAGDEAPPAPGGPPSIATPIPEVVVAPAASPTPTPADGRTTDWADPTPSPWAVPEATDPGIDGDVVPEVANDDGGAFEDLGTDVGSGTGQDESNLDGPPGPPENPPSGGGFEDLGTEVRPSHEGPPVEPDVAGQVVDDDAGGSSEPSGLTLMGKTAGSVADPTAEGPMVLLPPPGDESPGRDAAAPPAGPAPPAQDDDSRPFIPSRVNVNGAGQPAAYHIFATCSRLGWAGALARYSVGPADAAIADHLLIAGEHAMWANRLSYQPTPAWPDWQARRGLWSDWAARLARTRDGVFRGQIAHSLSTAHEALSQSLAVQTVDDTHRTPTCDAEYCRLGFLMAWGQQALAVAEEARRHGNARLDQTAAIDGEQRLRLARDRLAGYRRIIPASGRCADLTAVGGQLESAIGGGGSATARAAWEEALRAIMVLAPGQPPPSEGSLLGGWVLADGRPVTVTERGDSMVGMADGRELFRVRPQGGDSYAGQGLIATRSGDSERSRWYDGLSITVDGDTARGTLGQFGFTMTRGGESPLPRTAGAPADRSDDRCPVVHFNGEIEGDWAWGDCCPLRFTKVGDEWVGAFTRLNDDMAKIGHRPGQAYMRLTRSGPLTYEGEIITRWSNGEVIPDRVEVTVAGESFLKGHGKLSREGLVRRSDAGICNDPFKNSLAIGCRRSPDDRLECTVQCDPHPDLGGDTRNALEKLRNQGFPMAVFGPATFPQVRSWVIEHQGQPLCLDSLPPPSRTREAGDGHLVDPPAGEPGGIRIMGVEPETGRSREPGG
jgi:hypothetical protein